ncbi:MAG: peptide ABC transporter substrate-binding protein [Candidatus Saccharimonas sp.]
MDEQQKGWKLQRLRVNRKQLARRLKKAEGATQRHAHRFIVRRIDNARLVARQITIWLAVVGVLVAGLGIQMVWSQKGYTISDAPQSGGLYVEGALGPINTLNPLFVSTSAEASVARLLFSSLYDYDSKGELRQDLASGMQVDASNRIYTVSLKPNLKWHDGKPLTADDIVYTINLIKDPTVRSPLRVNWLDVSVSALSPTIVKFDLPAVYAAFPYALTFPILPSHILKGVTPASIRESTYSQAPVGSGPFKFHRLQSADTSGTHKIVHMSANSLYYQGEPKIARFELHAYSTEELLLRAINVGELSAATDISVTSLSSVSSSQYESTSLALDSGVYLLLNMQKELLKEQKLRQALQLATDTVVIRRELGGGVLPLDGPLLDGQLTGANVPHAPLADLKRAAQLLDELGWVNVNGIRQKNGVKLELSITTTRDKEYGAVLKLVASQWRKLGIKVNENVIDTTSAASTFVQNTLQARNFDVLLYKLAIGSDPDVYAYWHSSQAGPQGYNFSNYSSPLVDANLASARTRLEPELRQAKYRQFAKQWIDDVPAIALYQPVVEYLSNKSVHTVQTGTQLVTGSDRYADVVHWTADSGTVYKTP